MDALYTRAGATASRLLKKYSQGEYVLSRTGAPVVNPDAPWEEPTPGTPQTWTLDAIGKNVSRQFIDGSTVTASDREVLCATFDDEPKPGDVLTKDGAPLTIIKVMPVTDAPGIAWRFIVKG